MIVLPDEDDKPVAAQVHAVIGEALRRSVADAEPSPGFERRLAAALDAAVLEAGQGGAVPSEGGDAGQTELGDASAVAAS
ncbi:hypothetical protein [Pseudoduganella violaceinigra]|uniref:hypothetical protein n=1 Tax=Pseudoduganella violaceinigra TaxID=246602 RepID=UPI000400982E|nr:hypothetical protein [Pseudoduganella violaceinigra]